MINLMMTKQKKLNNVEGNLINKIYEYNSFWKETHFLLK